MRIEIIKGQLVDATQNINQLGSVFIEDDKIVGVLTPPADFVADQQIDAQGYIVCAGFIELNAHLREPGQAHKASIASETKAAASAGFTRLCLPPNTQAVIDTPAVVELIKDKAEKCDYPFVYPIAALTQKLAGKELSAMQGLKAAGCLAVSHAQAPLQNLWVLRRAMEYAATQDLLLIYCPQEASLSAQGCAHEGIMASRYGLPAIPVAAETIALMQCIELVAETGCRVHFRGLSAARSVVLIERAKKQGLPVTADVAMHQLHLTDADMPPYDSQYHVLPPLRSEHDKNTLLNAVKLGIIDSVCSDHQPHDIDAKLGAFPETEPGISSLESTLPLLLRLVAGPDFSLSDALAKLSAAPANILGLKTGQLAMGYSADICIFDPEQLWTVAADTWQSQGKNTPYWHAQFKGKVKYTLQAGRIIYSPAVKQVVMPINNNETY